MKKIFKTILLAGIIFLTCSCVKNETIMTINKDKSVDLKVNIGYAISSNKEIDINQLRDNLGTKGYSIDSYHDETYKGYTISKKFKNINTISTSEDINVNLADLITGNIEDSKFFKVKKGFFKNTYTANFNYDFSSIYSYTPKIYVFGEETDQNSIELTNYLNEYIKQKSYNIEVVKYNVLTNPDNFIFMLNTLAKLNTTYQKIPLTIINDKVFMGLADDIKTSITTEIDNIYLTGKYQDSINNDFDDNYALTFQVNLLQEAISSNATHISNNQKTLSWELNYFKNNTINFSFSIFNKSSIIIIILSIIGLVTFIIISLIFYQKYKKDKEKFVAKNSDLSSIIPQTDENNQIISVNDFMGK